MTPRSAMLEGPAARCYLDCAMSRPELLGVDGGQLAVYSHPAPDRTHNEDAALIQALPGVGLVLAVADGAGGYEDGARAARLAVETLQARASQAAVGELRATIVDAIEQASETLRGEAGRAATTLVAAEVQDGHIRALHVGDSALLVTSNRGRVKLQTVAHSPTGYAVEAGFLSEAEALQHDERHLVCNLLGDASTRIEIGLPLRLAPLDTVLLASDGLFDNLTVEQIVAIVCRGPLPRAARALAAACRTQMQDPPAGAPSKPDDLTFVLYRPRPGRRR